MPLGRRTWGKLHPPGTPFPPLPCAASTDMNVGEISDCRICPQHPLTPRFLSEQVLVLPKSSPWNGTRSSCLLPLWLCWLQSHRTMEDLHLLWLLERLWSSVWAGSAQRKAKTLQAIYLSWWKPRELSRGAPTVLTGNARFINKETKLRNFWTKKLIN